MNEGGVKPCVSPSVEPVVGRSDVMLAARHAAHADPITPLTPNTVSFPPKMVCSIIHYMVVNYYIVAISFMRWAEFFAINADHRAIAVL